MSNYEGKLGEWLKYVQQQVESVGKEDGEGEPEETPKAETPTKNPADWQQPESVVIRDRMGNAPTDDAVDVIDDSMLVDSSLIEDRSPVVDRRPALFDEADIPDVEEFLPFLRDPEPKTRPEPEMPRDTEVHETTDPNLLLLPEGTGEPKPMVRKPEESKPREIPVKAEDVPAPTPSPMPKTPARIRMEPLERMQKVAPPSSPDASEVRDMWDKLPRHIQLLVGQQPEEVAQNSYKEFTETREDLIQRLLDPTLSLEEAARILNVCPTTVRRYTNRGALRHFRTAGNQRRFRLSDVLTFLEGSPGSAANGTDVTEESVN